ncbi:MAG: SH3 domain-containing protein [Chloroflexi bacterium]|nr:SH3 domain-containing protein [Chloroflexota bacterium]
MQTSVKSVKQYTLGAAVALLFALYFSTVAFGQATTTGTVIRNANLRAGPGTSYAISGQADQGDTLAIIGQDAAGNWYHLATDHWIAAFLVNTGTETQTPTATVAARVQATPAPLANPSGATALQSANLRAGPGTSYAVTGGVNVGQALLIAGQNADGSWLQLADGAWLAACLVNHASAAPATSPAASQTAPVATPTATSVAPPPAASSGNKFVVVQKHLWDVYENGGSLFGPSVTCGLARELIVNVLDENGNRLNGVAVQVQYGAREIYVTGAQGKGDGVAEFVLGKGQDVKVIRDVDGRDVTSDLATGLSTDPAAIPYEDLISAQYCQDADTCKKFGEGYSCEGHFSWTITFKRQP